MGIEEQLGEIVIAPRVLEKIIAIATAKVDGVHSFSNKSVSDTLSKLSLGRGVYLKESEEELIADIYLYLEYGVKVPKVAMAIQKAVKDAVRNMADVELNAVNIHVAGIAPDKTPKPERFDNLILLARIRQLQFLGIEIKRGLGIVIHSEIHLATHRGLYIQLHTLVKIEESTFTGTLRKRRIIILIRLQSHRDLGRTLCSYTYSTGAEDTFRRTDIKLHIG